MTRKSIEAFHVQLAALGFSSYAEYLASGHWADVKLRYAKSRLSKKCAICGVRYQVLHHRTYRRLGREWLMDFVPLCHDHHRLIHSKENKLGSKSLWKQTMQIVRRNARGQRGRARHTAPPKGRQCVPSAVRSSSARFGGLLEVRALVSAWPRTFTPAGKTPSTAAAPLVRENASVRWGCLSASSGAAPADSGSATSGGHVLPLDWVLRLVYQAGTVRVRSGGSAPLRRPGGGYSSTAGPLHVFRP